LRGGYSPPAWPNEFGGIARWILSSGGAAAGYQPSAYGYGIPASGDVTGGVPFVIVGAVTVLYGFAAVAQGCDFLRTGLPLQGARHRLRAARAGAGLAVPRADLDAVVVGVTRAHAWRGRPRDGCALPERSQYDAIGDAVNTASRMESLTEEFHVDSILSRDTAERLRADGLALLPLGEAHVKGKSNPIGVFTLG
jgi:hypothetical protein